MSNPIIRNTADLYAAQERAKNKSDAETESRQPDGYFSQGGQQRFVKFNRSALSGLDCAASTKADREDFRKPGHPDAVRYYGLYGNDDDQVATALIKASVSRDGAEQFTPKNLSYEQKMLSQVKSDGTVSDANFAAKAKKAISDSWEANGYLTPSAPVVFGKTESHTHLTYRESIQQSLEKTHLEYFSDARLLEALRLVKGTDTAAARIMRDQRNAIQIEDDARRKKKTDQEIIAEGQKRQYGA
jgi:hypothetical protein